MSSAVKDARWQLAYHMLEIGNLTYEDIRSYGEFQTILDAAQIILNNVKLGRIQELADEWNAGK